MGTHNYTNTSSVWTRKTISTYTKWMVQHLMRTPNDDEKLYHSRVHIARRRTLWSSESYLFLPLSPTGFDFYPLVFVQRLRCSGDWWLIESIIPRHWCTRIDRRGQKVRFPWAYPSRHEHVATYNNGEHWWMWHAMAGRRAGATLICRHQSNTGQPCVQCAMCMDVVGLTCNMECAPRVQRCRWQHTMHYGWNAYTTNSDDHRHLYWCSKYINK